MLASITTAKPRSSEARYWDPQQPCPRPDRESEEKLAVAYAMGLSRFGPRAGSPRTGQSDYRSTMPFVANL